MADSADPDDRPVRMLISLWTQLADLCGATHRTARLHAFLALHDSVMACDSERLVERFATGLERGMAWQARHMGDDYLRGVVDERRRMCAELGCDVPAWVDGLAAEIAQRRAELSAEIRRDGLMLSDVGPAVH